MGVSFDLPYFPRPDLLEDVIKIYSTGLKQGVALFAPRRQGKTSFVKHELLPWARETLGWQTIYIDLWTRRDAPELALVEALEAELESRQTGWRRKLRLKEVKAKAKSPAVDVESTMEPVGYQMEDAIENRLSLALTALVGNKPTLLVLDEVQALAGVKRENFVAALRTVLQKLNGKLYVFYTGSSRDGLNQMFRVQRAPLFESAMSITLKSLDHSFVDNRLAFLKARSRAKVDRQAMLEAFEALGRTPEYLNELVLLLLLANDGDVAKSLAHWTAERQSTGAHVGLEGLKDLDRALLALLASKTPLGLYSAEGLSFIQARVARQAVTTGMVQAALRKLAKRGLVAPTGQHGEYEIEDQLLLVQLQRETP